MGGATSLVAQMVKNWRPGFDSWVGKIPWRREWQPNPVVLLKNPIDRGAWWSTVNGVTTSYRGKKTPSTWEYVLLC